jgi:chromosome partitioning protein
VATELASLAKKYDIIVADCAPSVEQPATWGALLASSLALIPTKLNAPDMDALPAAKRLARKVWDTLGGDAFPIRVVPNAVKLTTKDDQAALRTLRKDTEIPPTETTLGDRKAFSRSMLLGSTVHDARQSEDKSEREVEDLANEVLKLVGLPAKKGARK